MIELQPALLMHIRAYFADLCFLLGAFLQSRRAWPIRAPIGGLAACDWLLGGQSKGYDSMGLHRGLGEGGINIGRTKGQKWCHNRSMPVQSDH